jgi:hypothetical protein
MGAAMNRLLLIAILSVALDAADARADIVDLLFRPVDTGLVSRSQRSIHFKPTRDIELTGLGLIFDPIPIGGVQNLDLSCGKICPSMQLLVKTWLQC